MSKVEIKTALQDVGIDDKLSKQIIELYSEHQYGNVVSSLTSYRSQLVESIHDEQRRLYCLDFLIQQLRKGGS